MGICDQSNNFLTNDIQRRRLKAICPVLLSPHTPKDRILGLRLADFIPFPLELYRFASYLICMASRDDTQTKMTVTDVTVQLTSLSLERQKIEQIGQQILAWTNGQPVLTAHVIQLLLNQPSLLQDTSVVDAVNDLVQNYFSPDLLQSEATSVNRETLQLLERIHQGLLADRNMRDRLLKSYQDILLIRHPVSSGYTAEQQTLLDMGLVVQDNTKGLKVANPIYRRVFNRPWVEDHLRQPFALNKEHWALLTGLLSILAFALLQSTFRYLPLGGTQRCSQETDLKNAIQANFSLNAQQMEQAIERLRTLQQMNELTDDCGSVLHDLEYNYAIYVEAGEKNQPFNAAKRLCRIPESFYQENNIRPWFYRWQNIYKRTDFVTLLDLYVKEENCPAYSWLSSPNSL